MHRQLGPQPKNSPIRKPCFQSLLLSHFPTKTLACTQASRLALHFHRKTKTKTKTKILSFSLKMSSFAAKLTRHLRISVPTLPSSSLGLFVHVLSQFTPVFMLFTPTKIIHYIRFKSFYILIFFGIWVSVVWAQKQLFTCYSNMGIVFSSLHCLVVYFVKINLVLEVDIVEGLVQNIIFQHEYIYIYFFHGLRSETVIY